MRRAAVTPVRILLSVDEGCPAVDGMPMGIRRGLCVRRRGICEAQPRTDEPP